MLFVPHSESDPIGTAYCTLTKLLLRGVDESTLIKLSKEGWNGLSSASGHPEGNQGRQGSKLRVLTSTEKGQFGKVGKKNLILCINCIGHTLAIGPTFRWYRFDLKFT